ncbi:hypothetical protein EN925_03800 [Mesorhizobium sp. M7A.F.Ca.US.006.04.2.1]|uniref:hypothetical protein n=1 Tax=unclassified Mesorhizobium TaxID=325217 RepID=UPI000FCB460C|nr:MULTISPECIES: hypothetical protein [unclassified Mesorhizobium]RUX78264.1 hypothetical protein EN990_02605 [Mesorhizobium sp. M7A.F.Ca.US.005.03.1.1]RUY18873.1 hypothetical protein EN991_02605 [Mesorhizobium sp. M7A.F.Ca.US.005.03.2.1]RUY32201.1 hypothetical protein EN979_00355 [Mesorhizobium sp. M7A.F.Ca.US.001.04.2.1]RUY43297.1 hypothetical protein EN978_09890 [Mesorhizobium sp. M7A.F.Ca.US.001.04.1.1]RVA95446.1 hypothetical protein EN925_03800 [Mesorhizobium sp. M7A.F.Ca.US.006.04.2.1]
MNRSAAVGAIVWLSLTAYPAVAQQTFEGYDCTAGCSGHQAGYDWAERNGISDANDCDGNSQSFNEGCQAYVEEQQPAPDDEVPPDESDEDSSE